jgi:hypothetical protein
MARYIDADALLAHIESYGDGINPVAFVTMMQLKKAISFVEEYTADVVPRSEVERLEKALADKARECNMVVDQICLEHRAQIALLHSSHEAELATAKREGAWEIFAELDTMDIRIVRLRDAIQYMDLVKKYEYDRKKKYTEGE